MIGLTASLIIIIIIGFIYLTKKTKTSSTVQVTRTNLELQELNMPTAFANENVELRESNISSSKHLAQLNFMNSSKHLKKRFLKIKFNTKLFFYSFSLNDRSIR